ncbi:hypothetical protein ACNKHK_25065 [Shigella flexneri]
MKDVNDEELALIATMKAGASYVDYHIQFHQRIAKLLRKHQIITDMSEEAMVENDLLGRLCHTALVTSWACRYMMSLALCRMTVVPSGRAVEVSLPALHPYCKRAWF